jgi:CCR4-NOT transcription complex subunit 1
LLTISPLKMPKFCFAWFEAVSSTGFLGLFLSTQSEVLLEALKALFTFMKPVSEAYAFAEPSYVLYKGSLKLMAVILHDCPAFLVQNHIQLCLCIPKEFVQLRNIILAAVPESLSSDSLPDPLAPGLKIDTLPGIKGRPELPAAFITSCLDPLLSGLIDECLGSAIAASTTLVSQILNKISGETDGIEVVNFVALRVNSAFSEASFKTASGLLCSLLAGSGNASVRFGLLTGMVNHLRYPNYLTYFFSCVLLQAFRLSGTLEQQLKSQLVRVLLERLVVYRPHPWGLMITFMELIRNPEYRFWSQPLVKASPELERMFETVAKSCLVN